jgi:DNA-binding NtrC family response regulator
VRILIVDGDAVSSAALERLLARAGHTAHRAGGVAAALALCDGERFDLLVCEMDLADGSAAALARDVAARCGARVIGISSRDADPPPGVAGAVAPDPEAGAFDARLNKPFRFDDVLRLVAALYPPPAAGASPIH